MTLTRVAERLAVELSLPFLRFRSVANRDGTPISRMQGERYTSTPPRQEMEKFHLVHARTKYTCKSKEKLVIIYN